MASVIAVKRRGQWSSTDPASLPPDLFHQVLGAVFKSDSWKESKHRSLGVLGTNFTAALVSKKWHRASMRALTVARVTAEFQKETYLLKELTRFKALTKIVLCENAVEFLSAKFLKAARKNWPGLRSLVLNDMHTSFLGTEPVGAYLRSLTDVAIWDSRILFESVYDPLTSWMSSVENLISLGFFYCSIQRLPEDFGSRFPKLRRFRLSHIGGLGMLPESMGDLVGLRELVLDNCDELSALPRSFSRLSALKRLTWVGLNIRDVSIIANLEGLRYLYLDTCTCSRDFFAGPPNTSSSPLLQGLLHCTGLRVLKLRGCEGLLGDLGWLAVLTALRTFEVDSEGVPDLPANIGALKCLERASFKTGHFKTLPQSFGEMTSLRDLSIESFALGELPHSLTCLTRLTHLSLHTSLGFNVASMDLGTFTSLQTLSITGCSFPGIPEDLGFLPYLTELRIKCKLFNSLLPRGFPSLQELDIVGCFEPDVPGSMNKSEGALLTVDDYPCLRVLKISFWEAESLIDAVGHLRHLEHLELTDGDFTQLPETLSSLCSLKRLYLEDCNNIISVPASLGTISSFTSLRLDKCDSFDLESLTGRLKEVYETGI